METERKPGRRSTQKKTYVEEKDSDISDNEEDEKPIRKKEGRNSKKAYKVLDGSTNSSAESNSNGRPNRPGRRSKKITSESDAEDSKTNGTIDNSNNIDEHRESL